MIKREDMKEAASAIADTFFPDVKSEKARGYLARMLVEAIESWIECNRAKTDYYSRFSVGKRPYVRED